MLWSLEESNKRGRIKKAMLQITSEASKAPVEMSQQRKENVALCRKGCHLENFPSLSPTPLSLYSHWRGRTSHYSSGSNLVQRTRSTCNGHILSFIVNFIWAYSLCYLLSVSNASALSFQTLIRRWSLRYFLLIILRTESYLQAKEKFCRGY